jgi:glutamyl-Q tRNA(Asp) synthetase
LDEYRAALGLLEHIGVVYPAFESRAEIGRLVAERERQAPWPRDPDGAPLYPGTAKSLSPAERARRVAAGEPYALRLDMQAALTRVLASFRDASVRSEPGIQRPSPDSGFAPLARLGTTNGLTWQESGEGPQGETGIIPADPATWGDVILARKDAGGSYHLSVVVDDAAQGVTDVVRGRDLFQATGVHRLLQALLGLSAPHYHHHRLMPDADGRKLSKSTRATGLRDLRAQGLTPSDIRRMAGLD